MGNKLQNRVKSLKFYRKNRDEINRKRRELYQTDPRPKELAKIRAAKRTADPVARKKSYLTFNKRRRERYKNDPNYKDKELLRLMAYSLLKKTLTKEDMEYIKNKSNNSCTFCSKSEPEIKLTIDHIIPISKGGSNLVTNLQMLCLSCNCKKSNKL